MNTNQDLLQRLLHLYPMEELKNFFGVDGKIGDSIINIVQKNTSQAIIGFASSFQQVTKQNIFIYELDKNFSKNVINNAFPLKIELESVNSGEYSFFCLPKVVYSVYLNTPIEIEDLYFYQPVTIKIKNKTLVISYTKLVKNVSTYYPANRVARKSTEQNNEFITLNQILSFLKHTYTIVPLDLNKGVKFLWEKDVLDCRRIEADQALRTQVNIMKGELTFKQQFPLEYPEIIKDPLNSVLWKYLLDDDELCESFICDLSAGTINIPKFAKHSKQVENVIAKILTNN